jgi:O-antigen chain-terminating methyltransferase
VSNNENPIDWAAFYKAFEDRYRGSFDDIKNRLRFYVPILQDAGVGRTLGPVLDLGAGRCEWLDLLRDSSIPAEGVDINPHSAKIGLDLGLSVTIADIFEELTKRPSNYYGAITVFHVIEHLEWKDQMRLIQAAYHSLNPGGLLIIEWPNPENIYVSSQLFWLDPTHQRLLPWQLLSFMFEFCGFEQMLVERFRPSMKSYLSEKEHNNFIAKIFKWLKLQFIHQSKEEDLLLPFITVGTDIALIARKPDTVNNDIAD